MRVYGHENGADQCGVIHDNGVEYRFLPINKSDRLLRRFFRRTQRLHRLFNRGMLIPPSTSRLLFMGYYKDVVRELQEDPVDQVILQHNGAPVPLFKRLSGTEIIVNLHAPLFAQNLSSHYRKCLMAADQLTGVSNYIAHHAKQTLGRDAGVISNRVESKLLKIQRPPSGAEKLILYVGAVSPEKGVHVLIQAFNKVAIKHKNVRLEIIGAVSARTPGNVLPEDSDPIIDGIRPYFKSDYGARLREMLDSETAERTTFLGSLPHMDAVQRMAAADIFVFPSVWQEGFGLPPLEAQAVGTAVIASRSGALGEVVEEGKTGILVPRGDVDKLAESMEELLNNEAMRLQMGAAGKKRVEQSFLWCPK